MELHQLRYFRAVARAGSFTRAAEQEDVAQPSLSEQIRKLERELGIPLFERLGRSIRLTRYGEALLEEADTILNHVANARATITALQEGACGVVRVGAIPTILPFFLAPRLGEFQKKFPDIQIQLVEETTAKLVVMLQAGELDLAVAALPIKNPEIVCRELFRESLQLAVPPSHPLVKESPVDLEETKSERMLLLREGHCLRDDVLTACTRARAEFKSIFETDQMATIFSLVAGGFGISLVPEMAANQASGCVMIPLAQKAFRRIGYVQTRHRTPAKAKLVFLEWLRSLRAPH